MIKEILYKWFKTDPFPCESCETLKLQLAIANDEKREMLNTILSFSKPTPPEERVPIDLEKIRPKVMTWNMRKQMLEAEDKATAKIMAEQQKREQDIKLSIGNLEKEVGLEGVANAKA